MKVKIICGFRKDQEYSIDMEEAHKAYYLFLNPQERGIFENGLAIKGEQIQEIVPDYHGTMGWNSTHILDDDDWNEMRKKGIDKLLTHNLSRAKQVAQLSNSPINLPLSEVLNELKIPKELGNVGMKSVKDILKDY